MSDDIRVEKLPEGDPDYVRVEVAVRVPRVCLVLSTLTFFVTPDGQIGSSMDIDNSMTMEGRRLLFGAVRDAGVASLKRESQ